MQIKQSQPTGGRLRNEVSRRRGRSSGGKVAAKEPERLPEKAEEIANETAADDVYRQALESIRKEREKETTGYGSEYDTTYSSVLADYSIYLEDDGEGTRAMKITEASATSPARE